MGAAPPSDRLITHDGGLSTWGNAAGSQGYGETTLMSTHKLIRLLGVLRSRVLATFDALRGGEIHPAYDLGRDSAFIDVGSGYGEVVFHAALVARCSRSVGVECVHSRHRIAAQTAASLPRTDPPPPPPAAAAPAAPAAAAEAGAPSEAVAAAGSPAVFSGWASAVQLLWGDATQHPVANYTHVYVFDRVFAKHTMLALALQLQAAPFFVLASYRPPTEWSQYGLTKAAAVARIPMRTSGKETVTCWVYVNTHFLALSGGRARRPARAAPSARVGAADYDACGLRRLARAARPAAALRARVGREARVGEPKRLVAHLGPDGCGSWQLAPRGRRVRGLLLRTARRGGGALRADAYGLSWLIIEKTEAVAALMQPQPAAARCRRRRAAAEAAAAVSRLLRRRSGAATAAEQRARAAAGPQFSAGAAAARAPPPTAARDAAGPTPRRRRSFRRAKMRGATARPGWWPRRFARAGTRGSSCRRRRRSSCR